ncbi:hypothetical protein BDW02DRAFT_600264 [Decorospora gaudefroyi]|uniref:Uncharacterized protein n=1 Tax=Decorospora gaudefroyi TaxID=184978 RepID=A0A6A5KCF9_9PLEO|nr:hypothetical protein BDW02DRAFT_600264 [Decorospora gaudefroyi]
MSSSSSQKKRVRVLQLHYIDSRLGESGETYKDYFLTPSMTWGVFMMNLRASCSIRKIMYGSGPPQPGKPEVYPHDINGEPLFDNTHDTPFIFDNIQNSEHLLIAFAKDKRLRSQLPLKVVLFLEAEGAELSSSLMALTATERRNYLMTLRRRDAVFRKNICRIVLPHSAVKDSLNNIGNVSDRAFLRLYSVSNSINSIKNNWNARPAWEPAYKVTQKGMAYIGVLAEALCGQQLLAEDLLADAAQARMEAGGASGPTNLQEQDVLAAIQNLYEARAAVDSTWTNTQINPASSRPQAWQERKQRATAAARANADAAYIGKGKGKAVETDLAGKLGRAKLPNNYMPEDSDDSDDSDEDPVVKPGRARRG